MNKYDKFLEIVKTSDIDEVWVNFDHPFDRKPGDTYHSGDRVIICKNCDTFHDEGLKQADIALHLFFAQATSEDVEDVYYKELNLITKPLVLKDPKCLDRYNKMKESYTCIYRKGEGIIG